MTVTLVPINLGGIDRLIAALNANTPIVVPLPTPLPYVVVGASPERVNAAKGRPETQPVGVGIKSFAGLEPAMKLDAETTALARWLCFTQAVGILVPVSSKAPPWLAPATKHGRAFLGGAWLPDLDRLFEGRPHLYMSSGNTTTQQPALDAVTASATFGADMLVADGDHLRDRRTPHGSSTIITVEPRCALRVARPGINNRGASSETGYLADLVGRWKAGQ